MYSGHGRLCFCVSVPRRIPTLLHGPICLGEWYGVPSSCGLLGGFVIGARFRCYDNIHVCKLIAMNAKCQRVLVVALCLVYFLFIEYTQQFQFQVVTCRKRPFSPNFETQLVNCCNLSKFGLRNLQYAIADHRN